MTNRELKEYTVLELKTALRAYGLQSSGAKTELINRLLTADPDITGKMADILSEQTATVEETQTPLNTQVVSEIMETAAATETTGTGPSENGVPGHILRELELLRREKAVLEREVRLLTREQRFEPPIPSPGNSGNGKPHVNINTVGNLVSEFSEDSDLFDKWSQQITLIKRMYDLDDDAARVLIGAKLKGRALKWLHSKTEFLEMPVQDLLDKMAEMFNCRMSKIERRREFEQRTWKASESFVEYYHEKVILANKISIEEPELIDCIIDGIPDVRLKDQARMHQFGDAARLLDAFRKITLKKEFKPRQERSTEGKPPATTPTSENYSTSRCYNCSEVGHLSAACPKPRRAKGACFECGSAEHRVKQCPKRATQTNTASLVYIPDTPPPFMVPVSYSVPGSNVNKDFNVMAVINTGSPVSLMLSAYVPDSERRIVTTSEFEIRGLNGTKLVILGLFDWEFYVNDIKRNIKFLVVPTETMPFEALLGRDYIIKYGMNIPLGNTNELFVSGKPSVDEHDSFEDQLMLIDVNPTVDTADVLNINKDADRELVDRLKQIHRDIDNTHSPRIEHDFEMSINLKNTQPITFRPRRLSFAEKEKLREILDDLLKDGIIRPSESPYTSPIVLVRKKDGSITLCVDYRELNKITIKDNFPTPLIEDHLDRLRNKTLFSKLDLKNGFFHIKMSEDSIKYTSFVTPWGQFEYTRMPFGLTNAPRTFRRFLSRVFKSLIERDRMLLYADDILVGSQDRNEHLETLREIFTLAKRHNLKFRLDKCTFLNPEITYLGYTIDHNGIRPSGEHVESI
ncbi:uncharacterized protein [Prorops nasuta]|uniref:uncharacterized protein n=1 Tax=Prorops nasuta TaxID=863751 RepID=UPI0034CE12D7